jgi:hypothetical protein
MAATAASRHEDPSGWFHQQLHRSMDTSQYGLLWLFASLIPSLYGLSIFFLK